LNPSSKISSLSWIDIPSCHTDAPFPEGPDPKQWKGPWKSITHPTDIARHVSAANRHQYGQVKDTTFGSDPLLSLYRYNADTSEADGLLKGNLPPPSILDQLYPETVAILSSLASPSPHQLAAPSAEITQDQFTDLDKALNEATLSSPSGRHIGHCKVATKHKHLSTLHSQMMSIPLYGWILKSKLTEDHIFYV
jgi:hypothetical protein